jgi:hypothetical protein
MGNFSHAQWDDTSVSNEVSTTDEIVGPVLRISNEIRVPNTFIAADPTIGTLDNSGYGINIHKIDGIGFTLGNDHKMVLKPNGNLGIGLTDPNVPLHVRRNQSGWLQEIAGTSPDPGEFVGLKLLSGYAGDTSKWVGVAAISESQYSNQTGLGLFTGQEERFRISQNGNVGIGTQSPDSKLAVNGIIHAKEVRVDLTGWPDYIFKEGYDIKTLEEVQNYIKKNGHLPNIPSAKEVEENGIELGKMNKLLLEKIEELTLYIIDQEGRIRELETIIKT